MGKNFKILLHAVRWATGCPQRDVTRIKSGYKNPLSKLYYQKDFFLKWNRLLTRGA
jgi:hypothetical protein